jgi:hypothetical protein
MGMDPYPFKGLGGYSTCYDGIRTLYTGYLHQNGTDGLQNSFKYFTTSRLDTYRAALKDSSWADSVEIRYMAQMQSSQRRGCPDSVLRERWPTGSEMRCEASIALCYGIRGLFYWPGDTSSAGNATYFSGLLGRQGYTEAWGKIANYVTPYVKAIDDIYLQLEWQRGYPYHDGYPENPPPIDAFIDSIFAVSNSPDSNPDLGWFHVGEFDDGEAYYAMIVNRACSQGPEDPTEAPSITATIRFNDDNLGSEHHYYIIDLATGTDSSDWEGVPETTYTAVMGDGTIPFTTTFRAGEGRLFKIAAAR